MEPAGEHRTIWIARLETRRGGGDTCSASMEAAGGRETGEEGGEGEMMGGGRKGLGDAFGSGRRRRSAT